ncbi:hypothetical protein O9992_00685 [Vibrio lentus]|nr:hypothetical protein [Vibrio lentus]
MSISSSAICPRFWIKFKKKRLTALSKWSISKKIWSQIFERKNRLGCWISPTSSNIAEPRNLEDELCAVCVAKNHAQIEEQLTLERYLSEKHVMLTHDNYRVHQLTEFHSPIFQS